MIVDGGSRCCPKCGSARFNREVSCAANRGMQNGATFQCLNDACNWTGYALQLVAKHGANKGPASDHPALKWDGSPNTTTVPTDEE